MRDESVMGQTPQKQKVSDLLLEKAHHGCNHHLLVKDWQY